MAQTIPSSDAPDGGGKLKRLVAEALPGYEIGEELGRGGCGVVFAGTHRRLGRRAAIKALAPGVAAEADADIRARFLLEGEALAALDHPAIVAIHDYVEHDGMCVLVMERVQGQTLWANFVERGMTRPGSCLAVIAICGALQHAHGRGVLHRDVKPGNVVISDDGLVKVIDFGIAKVIGGGVSYATRTGQLLGTPAYMAPEQIEGGELGEATDVYGAGTVFYELLCGNVPFPEGKNVWDMVARKIREPPEPVLLRDGDVPTALAEVAMRAVARDAGDRFASAGAFAAAIDAAAERVWGYGWAGRADAAIVAPGPAMAGGRQGQRGSGGTAQVTRVFPAVSRHVDGRFAVAAHEVYRAARAVVGGAGDASVAEWEDLPEALKVSSQAFADDIFAKLRGIDCTVHPVFGREVAVLEFMDDEVEDLAKKEHRRWVR